MRINDNISTCTSIYMKSVSDVTATDMDNCLPIYPLTVLLLVSVFLPIHPAMSAEIDDVAVANQVYP